MNGMPPCTGFSVDRKSGCKLPWVGGRADAATDLIGYVDNGGRGRGYAGLETLCLVEGDRVAGGKVASVDCKNAGRVNVVGVAVEPVLSWG